MVDNHALFYSYPSNYPTRYPRLSGRCKMFSRCMRKELPRYAVPPAHGSSPRAEIQQIGQTPRELRAELARVGVRSKSGARDCTQKAQRIQTQGFVPRDTLASFCRLHSAKWRTRAATSPAARESCLGQW